MQLPTNTDKFYDKHAVGIFVRLRLLHALNEQY